MAVAGMKKLRHLRVVCVSFFVCMCVCVCWTLSPCKNHQGPCLLSAAHKGNTVSFTTTLDHTAHTHIHTRTLEDSVINKVCVTVCDGVWIELSHLLPVCVCVCRVSGSSMMGPGGLSKPSRYNRSEPDNDWHHITDNTHTVISLVQPTKMNPFVLFFLGYFNHSRSFYDHTSVCVCINCYQDTVTFDLLTAAWVTVKTFSVVSKVAEILS